MSSMYQYNNISMVYHHLGANVVCLPVGLRANKYLSTYKYCVNDSAASSSKNDQISRKYFMAYIGRKLYSHRIHLNFFKIRKKLILGCLEKFKFAHKTSELLSYINIKM